ncbi:PSD1 and planctomycete cytochrome C domain-containing protein [Verrucomicrobiota bacterium sgz303538]
MKPILFLFALASTAGAAAMVEVTPEQKQFFEQKIAPILSDSCFKCHSHAEGKTKGGLALDSREALLKGGDDGHVIVPGDPGKSMMIERVLSKDPDEKMPPKEATLSQQQIADLTAWIKMGAPDPRSTAASAPLVGYKNSNAKNHWAWQPIRAQAVPAVTNAAWPKTPVDSFVLAKLEASKITPSAPAERATLIRRAYFDLIGLPPMPWEVQAFVDDKSPSAWEKVIDRLLASPHYGERWGRYWLDVSRYSDTKGDANRRESPVYASAWTYRDYVIDAFNQDKPYDRFILEQLAADKLNLGQDKRPLAGLGFLTLGDRFNNNKNDIINDRIDVVTKGFLGLTVSCARCHDHMFDPIPQKDYYSLHGIFASTVEPKDNPIITAQTDAAQYQDYLKAREAALSEAKQYAEGIFTDIQQTFRGNVGDVLMASVASGSERAQYLKRIGGRPREIEEMLRFVRQGGLLRRSPVLAPWYQFVQLPASEFAERAPVLAARVANGGDNRRFPINQAVAAMFKGKSPRSLQEVAGYYAELFTKVVQRIDEEKAAQQTAAAQHPASVVGATAKALALPPVTTLASANKAANLDSFSKTAGSAEPSPSISDAAFAELRYAPFPRDPLVSFDPEEDTRLLPQRAQNRLATLLQAVSKVDLTHPGAPKRAMAVEDAAKPINSPVFIRGEANNRGEVVPHRFLEILSGPNRPEFTDGSGRLELAQAIASKSNPLTARVMVNRIWLHHFGEGIITTPDDFGTQAAPPSHPELLDYLASRFMQSGWSVKAMHKLIMLSATYQQQSDTNPKYAEMDPNNRLLWRYNIRRLEFEPIRDSLLYIAGKLDTKVGGQPVNILSEPYSMRRSVYGYIDRANLPEMMNHFDFANPGMPLGKRHETTVPQQALFMMNSPLMVEIARRLLDRQEMAPADTDEKKIHALYWMIYQRPPKPDEVQLGLQFIASVNAVPKPDDQALASMGDAKGAMLGRRAARLAQLKKQQPQKQPLQNPRRGGFVLENEGEKVDRRPLTSWEKYAHALLMANEAVYYN